MSTPPAKRFNWRNLGARVASGFVLVPAVLLAVKLGGWAIVGLAVIVAVGLAYEWALMSAATGRKRLMTVIGLAVVIPVVVAHLDRLPLAWLLVAVGAVLAGLAAKGAVERRADAAYGVIYITPPCIALVWLRDDPNGVAWTMLLLMTTWFADTGAYAFGNIFKGPKLWPRFSPNKTWSGFFGGLLCGAVAAGVVWNVSNLRGLLPLSVVAGVGLLAALATMAGDLWESVLKRRFGVKDSGDIIPGHGGILDRVDGLMFAIIVVALARVALGWVA